MVKTVNNEEDMKTKLFIIAILAMLFASCQDDTFNGKQNGNVRVFADSPFPVGDTRLSFSGDDKTTSVSWDIGDAIGIFTEEQFNLQYNVSSQQDGITEFVAEYDVLIGKEGEEVYAYYPYGYTTDDWIAPLPDIESQPFIYAKGKIQQGTVNFQFKHFYAYLKLTLTSDILPHKEKPSIYGVHIQSEEPLRLHNAGFDLKEEKIVENDYTYGDELMKLNFGDYYDLTQGPLTIYIPILMQNEGTRISIAIIHTEEEYNGSLIPQPSLVRTVPEGGFQAGHVYSLNTSRPDIVQLQDEQKEALIALYKASDGDNWTNNTNWLSDKPIHEWYGVNSKWGDIAESPYVVALDLSYNNLHGTLPEEFAVLMNTADYIDLAGNRLSGVIPENVRTHEQWNRFGWAIIPQSSYWGAHFDMTDINLCADDIQVEYLEGGTSTLYSLLAKNKITQVITDTPSDERANIHLSYHNKGFGTIIYHNEGEREEVIERVEDYEIKDMVRLWKTLGEQLYYGLRISGSTYLLDDKGNVIEYLDRDWGIPEKYYNSIIDSILYARLGEPEEHPIFESGYYISTDYSRDGEVLTLQEATQGQGIDLVFMGDGYVDKDMGDNGKYEQFMMKSMEIFFSIEPYKSFRNRFNVYAVKVVSGTEYMTNKISKMQLRLGSFNETGTDYAGNDDACLEYAKKVNGIDLDRVTIVNVFNSPVCYRLAGYCNMYESGASISHIYEGGPSEIIIHEAGGHGLAKLLDEYLAGYGTATEADKADFNAYYTSRGWGANVDLTNSPTEIKWAHMLADPRYQNEVGIYEGAWRWSSGAYRPSENSVMNNDYSWFNAPGREAIYKAIMQLSEGDGWTYDFEEFAAYDAINRDAYATKTRSVSKQDKRKVIHKAPTIIRGSVPKNNFYN